ENRPPIGNEDESVQAVENSCVCSKCGKNQHTKLNLEFHMRLHTGAQTYICNHCPEFFTNKTHLNNHIRFVHNIQVTKKEPTEAESAKMAKKHVCTECGQRLSSKQCLTEHMLQHAGEKPFLCPHCNTSFCGTSTRNRHIRFVHQKKPFGCLSCDEKFIYKDHLKKHLADNEGHQAMEEPPLY
ncbi:hypothetical protein PMAYCL1PPCAC_05400, partial [Pristionchus mayeri]